MVKSKTIRMGKERILKKLHDILECSIVNISLSFIHLAAAFHNFSFNTKSIYCLDSLLFAE